MKPEIKQRIEQIKAGQVPDGYKKTKIGIVPTEWNDTCFSDLFISKSEYTENLEKYPLYSLTIEDGVTAKSERYERSHLVKKENAYKVVEPNDFAYNPMNVRFGAVARHKGNNPVSVSGYYDIFTTKEKSDLEFMDSFLVSDMMIKYYNRVSTGSLVEKQRVHFSEFIEFNIPLPCSEVREKIAKLLSAQDKIIELKKNLLEEKNKHKKYLMQKIFNNEKYKKKLNEKWTTKNLDVICSLVKGEQLNKSMLLPSGDHYVLNGGVNPSGYSEKWNTEENTISVSEGGSTCGFVAYNTEKFWSGGHNYTLQNIQPSVNTLYLYYFLKSNEESIMRLRVGSGLPNIQKSSLGNFKVAFPPLEVQVSIAQALETVDKEIDLLQKEVDKERQKKKSLMQLLLTGIVRV